MFSAFSERMNNLSVLRHLANNILVDPVEVAACHWAADELERKLPAFGGHDTQELRDAIVADIEANGGPGHYIYGDQETLKVLEALHRLGYLNHLFAARREVA